jgi:tetratricopeptide (TPR) repeat protein
MTTASTFSYEPKSNMAVPVMILEAPARPSRRAWLSKRVKSLAEPTERVWFVCSDFDDGGPWAGVKGLVAALLPEIQKLQPDLLDRHSFELAHVMPQLRRSLTIRNPTLTDLAEDDEKVRNYAADRAYRIVHGLIDMIDYWKRAVDPNTSWIIGCDAFDLAGPLSQYFFKELMRRRGAQLRLRLVVTVECGMGERARSVLESPSAPVTTTDLPDEPPVTMEPSVALKSATELAARIGNDRIEIHEHLPELIKLWKMAEAPKKVLHCKYLGLALYSKLGLYADSLRYGEGLLDMAAEHQPGNASLRWWITIKLLNAYTGLLEVDSALALAEAAIKETECVPIAWGIHLYYMAAMLYARYKQPRDLAKGEEYLDRGLEAIRKADISEPERHFRAVFNRNGVAMIRSFEGRFEEALELCRDGIAELNAYLSPDRHRLHRSILLYNIAQVYVATNSYEKALQYFSAAMEMDPNYSEYYNERGNILLAMERFDEAHADYLRAIELSPPYFEVFTNLGQCYRCMGMLSEAIEAYSRAIDLKPDRSLALLGRAKAEEELGHPELAMVDYTEALLHDRNLWDGFASRGILHYEKGNPHAALSDFNQAIGLNPNQPDLYQNRAVVLMELNRHLEALRDLQVALELETRPEDRLMLQSRLQDALQAVTKQESSLSTE